MKTLFLNPPSFEGFDGGAGSRYQARREIRSFWYPTWLAQPAAMVPNSRLVDAPANGLSVESVVALAPDYELCVLHTSTPSFDNDIKIAAALKAANPKLLIGLVGAHVAVNPDPSIRAATACDFVANGEFDYTIQEIAAGRPLAEVAGITYRDGERYVRTADRPVIEDMDALPSVIDIYRRDLVIEDYFIGYLQHPYLSFYTGRGCKSRCTFCLWPQTIAGHRYRTRSPAVVAEEIRQAQAYFPQVKEFFFDDDTFTDDLPRVAETARLLGKLGVTWSCNAKANVPYETLKIIVTGWVLRFTALLSWACRAKPRRRSRKPSAMRARSTRTRSRSRWPQPTQAPACMPKRRATTGCDGQLATSWPTTVCKSARWNTRTYHTRKSLSRSLLSTSAFIFGREKLVKLPGRCSRAGPC